MPVRRAFVEDLYRNVLGRGDNFAPHEVEGWLNAADEESVRQAFLGSPEYTAQYGGQATWQDVGGVMTPTQPSGGGYQVQGMDDTATPRSGSTPTPAPDTEMDRARAGLRSVYRQFRPQATDAELNIEADKWLSGQYGWGSGLGDYDKFVSAILGSPEARAYRPQPPSDPNSRSLEYWQSRGVPAINIMDPTTGRLRAGWKRTANGYEPTSYTGFTGQGDFTAFNTGREQDPTKSAKDAFAWIAGNSAGPPLHDRRALPGWFNTYIRPTFEAMGNRVIDVSEDGFTYENHEGRFFVDYGLNAGAAAGSMPQRLQWNATPADDATRQRYAGTGGGGGGGGAGGGGRSGSGVGDLAGLLDTLGRTYGGPGGPGITTGPLQQVGQDPLSHLITGGLADFLQRGGTTPYGQEMAVVLRALIDSGGRRVSTGAGPTRRTLADTGEVIEGEALPGGDDVIARRFETAREMIEKTRRTMINDLRGDLANRNLLSEPGIPQGVEIGAVGRITERLAPEFAQATRDILSDEFDRSDARLVGALQMATNLSQAQANAFLAAVGEGTARQSALADIALRTLQTNMAWNQFLAEFGLKRDQVLMMLQQGRTDDVMSLLNSFLSLASLSRGGFV